MIGSVIAEWRKTVMCVMVSAQCNSRAGIVAHSRASPEIAWMCLQPVERDGMIGIVIAEWSKTVMCVMVSSQCNSMYGIVMHSTASLWMALMCL